MAVAGHSRCHWETCCAATGRTRAALGRGLRGTGPPPLAPSVDSGVQSGDRSRPASRTPGRRGAVSPTGHPATNQSDRGRANTQRAVGVRRQTALAPGGHRWEAPRHHRRCLYDGSHHGGLRRFPASGRGTPGVGAHDRGHDDGYNSGASNLAVSAQRPRQQSARPDARRPPAATSDLPPAASSSPSRPPGGRSPAHTDRGR